MADLISRLKLESGEFDSRIQRATKGLLQMEKECREVGGTLAYLEKEQLDFVKGLGQMETVSQDARGKINELSKAYTELSLQYKRLTDEEKKGQYGKALAASLEQLKVRIKEHKKELSGVEGQLTDMGDALRQLGSKIGIPMELFTKFGPIIAAVGVAAKVAKDTFNANESAVDEWGRTVESAKSIYEGFVTSLNTGDFSGFLNRMGNISAAARKAYDELDRLGTMKTIQTPEMSRQQTENERNRMMIQTRRYIAPLDSSQGIPGMKNGQLLTEAQLKQIEADLQNGIQRVVTLVTNEIDQTSRAIESEYERQANVIGLSLDEFKKGTSSMAEFDRVIELAKKYYEFENAHTTTYSNIDNMGMVTTTRVRDNEVNPYEGAQKWNVFRVDGEAYNKLVQLIQQREQQTSQAYSMQSQAYRAINRAEGISVRGGKGSKETTPQEKAEEKVAKALEDYATTLNLAAIRKEAGLDEEDTYKAKELSAHEKLFDAYTEAYNIYADPKYKEAFDKEAAEILDLARVVKELKDEKEKQKQADQELKRAEMEAARQMKQLDTRILGGLTNTAKRVGLTAGDIGMTGVKTRIDAGVDITEEEWTVFQNNLNERLQSLGLDPIQINFETGNIETVVNEAKAEFERLMSDFSSGVGAVGDLVGAMDNLKSIGDDLADVFSGEMDAWDSLITVLNSGISVLETIISVTEAINTLKSLGIGLSEKKATTEGVEAAATVSAASIEASAEGEKAAASLGAAGANAAESSSAAGKAVSWIPIVGPILAVAAIAAVLGSTIAAISKSKSAGHYAQGGIVPGSDYTDSTPVFVSSGELILNKAQQNNVASAIQDRNPLGNLKLVSRLSGKDILIAIDNTNRSEGGSRGYYTRIH